MPSRLPRAVATLLALTLALVLPSQLRAANIEMKNGTLYAGVTITQRDSRTVEFYAKYGQVTVPLTEVARIDGVPIWPAPTAARPTAIPVASPAPAAARPTSAPAITGASPPPPIPGLNAPSLLLRPADTVAPTPFASPSPPPWALPAALDPAGWELSWSWLVFPALVLVWLLSVRQVWRDGQEAPGRRSTPLWVMVALVLPIGGYVLYFLVRLAGQRPGASQHESLHDFVFLDADHQPIMIQPGAVGSGLENAKSVLQAAIFDRASDVHIEPGAEEYRVRFRIDGVLNPRMGFPAENGLRLVAALKNVAQLDISDRRTAQDGRFGGRAGGRAVDFRAATTPTVHGEKLVLRILDQKSGVRGLSDLGMTPQMMARFGEVIRLNSGMILATGPTGSGKTSSLYAALTQLDAVQLNIVTIEDPVEYELAGATQIPVNVKAGITYESGLRSILRQDPDVILVGEMRDQEAAQIALRSALTGHLVFSSLHSRDAVGTIHRLEEMGIERHLLASALLVVLSQRLVRVLCPACRRPTKSTGQELAEIGLELPADVTIYEPGGCRRCESSGYVGRTGLFEMLILDEALRQEINAGTPEDEFAHSARAGGYRAYREDGAEKILLGVTSVDEVLRAI